MKVTLCCPSCRRPLVDLSRCECGLLPRAVDGVLDLMTPEQESRYAEFTEAFERIRYAEGFGSGDLDLPFKARRNRHIWAVRRRTFKRLKRWVLEAMPEGGQALDAGAGNCWLSGHLSRWHFDVVATDVNGGSQDGLAAGVHYLEQGCRFDRIRAPMEALPFSGETFDLVVAGASFHYAGDPAETLEEFHRILNPLGVVIIFDSPWYEREADGRRAQMQRARDYARCYDLDETLAHRADCLIRSRFEDQIQSAGFACERINVSPGPGRTLERLRARLFGQHAASFPLLVLRRQD